MYLKDLEQTGENLQIKFTVNDSPLPKIYEIPPLVNKVFSIDPPIELSQSDNLNIISLSFFKSVCITTTLLLEVI